MVGVGEGADMGEGVLENKCQPPWLAEEEKF